MRFLLNALRTICSGFALFAIMVASGCSFGARQATSLPPSGAPASIDTFQRKANPDIYKITDLNKAVGGYSQAPLVAVGSTLYGTTTRGGAYNCGTVFKVVPGGTPTLVYAFKGKPDGCASAGGLINVRGILYGTSVVGGATNSGTVFKLTTSGHETVLHSFSQTNGDAWHPYAALTNVDGVLYGAADYGGVKQFGAIFRVTHTGDERVLYSFKGGIDDGANPVARLTYADGKLFGTTSSGTRMFSGTVFSITTAGVKKNLHVFDSNTLNDGMMPLGDVAVVDGELYGTTSEGGSQSGGTLYKISETGGGYAIVYDFPAFGGGGFSPAGDLLHIGTSLYGTTIYGGPQRVGTVFGVTLQGQETTLHSFAGNRDGSMPVAGVVDFNGLLYGTTPQGGATTDGVIYALSP